VFQHELDHLAGILLIERLDDDTRKAALRTIREVVLADEIDRGAPQGLRLS
jgi:peptide deformylase